MKALRTNIPVQLGRKNGGFSAAFCLLHSEDSEKETRQKKNYST
jgi:hypothetical protein